MQHPPFLLHKRHLSEHLQKLYVQPLKWFNATHLSYTSARTYTGSCYRRFMQPGPESKFHWQRLEPSTWNPESKAWIPESVLDSLVCVADVN